MSKICRNCGNTMNDNDISCTRCGFAAPVQAQSAGWTPVRILVLVAAALLILATFLPYASATASIYSYTETITVKLIDGGGSDGILFIAVAVVSIIFAVVGKPIIELVCGVAACALSLFELSTWDSQISELNEYARSVGVSVDVTRGTGFFLMFIASIALLILGIVHFIQEKK